MPSNIWERFVLSGWMLLDGYLWLLPYTPHPEYFHIPLAKMAEEHTWNLRYRFWASLVVRTFFYVYLFFMVTAMIMVDIWFLSESTVPSADPTVDSATFVGIALAFGIGLGVPAGLWLRTSAHVLVVFVTILGVISVAIGPDGNTKAAFAGKMVVFVVSSLGIGGLFAWSLASVTAETLATFLVWVHHVTYAIAVSLVFGLSLTHAINGLREQLGESITEYMWPMLGCLIGAAARLLWVAFVSHQRAKTPEPTACRYWLVSAAVSVDAWPFPDTDRVARFREQLEDERRSETGQIPDRPGS